MPIYPYNLLANIKVINHSKSLFELSNISITHPNGIKTQFISGSAEAGETTYMLYKTGKPSFGTYYISVDESVFYKYEIDLTSWEYTPDYTVPTVTIKLKKGGPTDWEIEEMGIDEGTVKNTLRLPAGYKYYDLDIAAGDVSFTPPSGTGTTEIVFEIPKNIKEEDRAATVYISVYHNDEIMDNYSFTLAEKIY